MHPLHISGVFESFVLATKDEQHSADPLQRHLSVETSASDLFASTQIDPSPQKSFTSPSFLKSQYNCVFAATTLVSRYASGLLAQLRHPIENGEKAPCIFSVPRGSVPVDKLRDQGST
jgi:hypothetical protein